MALHKHLVTRSGRCHRFEMNRKDAVLRQGKAEPKGLIGGRWGEGHLTTDSGFFVNLHPGDVRPSARRLAGRWRRADGEQLRSISGGTSDPAPTEAKAEGPELRKCR
jgi:hypothetical protein